MRSTDTEYQLVISDENGCQVMQSKMPKKKVAMARARTTCTCVYLKCADE